MGIMTPVKERHPLRKIQRSIRHHQGYSSTPSERAFELNSRNAYFWRR